MYKRPADDLTQGIVNRVQLCKYGWCAQRLVAPYAFVEEAGEFPHSFLLFNCSTVEGKGGRTLATSHTGWRADTDEHMDFFVNSSSQACGVCRKTLREHAVKLEKAAAAAAAAAAVRGVGCSSAGGISVGSSVAPP